MPCWLDQPGCPPGSRFKLNRRGCRCAARATCSRRASSASCPTSSATTPARPLLFGHGLFQDATAVDTIALLAVATNAVICGTNFTGMANEDLPNAGMVSSDLSRFPTIADRLQQGILNFMFLGRAMIHPDGLSSNPEFAGRIKTERLFYAGASLGGIIGGALTSVAPDFERSALIVPGLRFSLLLTRSTPVPHLRPDPLRQVHRPGRASAGQLDDPAALGPRRGERLRLPHGRATRCRTPRRRRCCCMRRSATTR